MSFVVLHKKWERERGGDRIRFKRKYLNNEQHKEVLKEMTIYSMQVD